MYRAFNLTNLSNFDELKTIDVDKARREYESNKYQVTKDLSIDNILKEAEFLQGSTEVRINADEIQRRIFPTYQNYDIFISHSHKDLQLVQKLAYYLRVNMGVKVFIDSEVWGYVDDLLLRVNNKYALKSKGLYDYTVANIDASNVYLMLSNAIHDVINATGSLFFINTPNSLNVDSNIKSRNVESPWIYDELKFTSTVKRRVPDYIQGYLDGFKRKIVTDSIEPPKWTRDVSKEVNGLMPLSNDTLLKWKIKSKYNSTGLSMLDFYSILYGIGI